MVGGRPGEGRAKQLLGGSRSGCPDQSGRPKTCGVPTQTLALPPIRLAGRPFQLPLLSSRRPVTVGRCERQSRRVQCPKGLRRRASRPRGSDRIESQMQSQEMSRSWARKGICSFFKTLHDLCESLSVSTEQVGAGVSDISTSRVVGLVILGCYVRYRAYGSPCRI
jgi:hypothetical protein